MKEEAFVEKDTTAQADSAASELVIATITGFDEEGKAQVLFTFNEASLTRAAISTINLHRDAIGRQVALMFVGQDPEQPIVIGLIKSRLDDLLEALHSQEVEIDADSDLSGGKDTTLDMSGQAKADEQETEKYERAVNADTPVVDQQKLLVDGKSVTIEGEDEIVLKCGESSITLTKSGKILIRGKYLLNRSTGVNRIMGGSVQVN